MSSMSGGEVIRIFGMIGLLAGCVPAHPYSMQVDGERVVVDVLKPDELKGPGAGERKLVAPVITAATVPASAHYVIKSTTPVFNEDTLEHTATYSGTKAASKFYGDDKPGTSVQFGGVKITRSIVSDGKSQPAAILTFSVDAQELPTNGQL